MNYNKVNYPNGYKKIVQPARPCHMPMPTPYPAEPLPLEPINPMNPMNPINLVPNMPLEPMPNMPLEPMPNMPPKHKSNPMNPMQNMPLEPMPNMPLEPMPNMPPKHKSNPMNPMQNMPLEPMPNMPHKHMKHTTPTPVPNQTAPALNLFPVDEGYVNGTIFRGLFRPYKNMRPTRPQLNTEKERMLFNVNKNHFAMTELQFYLNNFPNDVEALRIFNEFRRDYVKAKNDYESRFGALTMASDQLDRGPWNWVQTLAPWKRGV